MDPSLIDKQMRLKRKKLEDNLNDKLSFRPGPLELVKQNILEAGTEMGHAVQEGAVPFTDTTASYEETRSPDSVESLDLSPESNQVASPPSATSSPGATSISSSVQALASLQAQTRKHSLEQQEQQQQQHQLFLQQQNGQQQQAFPSQLPVSVAGMKKEARPRKKTAKSKVKKYKYHEYRPPNGEVQKSELPSDSPYGLLLQQQQLYLQLQVLFQNYPQHCMLPVIPENVKLGANGTKNTNKDFEAEKNIKIEDMRVVDMRRALKERGLPVFGSKTDLIKRLKECEAAESNACGRSSPSVVVSSQGLTTTTAPTISQPQLGIPKHLLPPLQRSNSVPLQSPNLNTVQQLQMQILANNQSLQQLSVPPEVQQQLQQLQYLNLQLQLQHMNIQQQQNIQPKPQGKTVTSQAGAVKTETSVNKDCSIQGRSGEQAQLPDNKPMSFGVQQQGLCMQMMPGNLQQQQQQQQQAPVHPHRDNMEQANSLDSMDSNPSSVDSQMFSWDQQHPLFDGGNESYPSPGSQLSDMSSPLQVDQLSHSMEAMPNSNVYQGNSKADVHPMQRSFSDRSPSDAPDDYVMAVPQTKPRSLSEPQFPISTQRQSLPSASSSYASPPPSYEAHMASKHQNMTAGCSMTNDLSTKQNDVDLPLDSVIQDKELSQELQKVCPSTIDLQII